MPELIYSLYRSTIGDYDTYFKSGEGIVENTPVANNVAIVIFILSTFALNIVMLNLLISIIGDTFNLVNSLKRNARNLELTLILYEIEKTMMPMLRK